MTSRTQRDVTEIALQVTTGGVSLSGDLALPEHASGLVLFAHGSGSSRHSPRNRHVAQALQSAGPGTLLLDLLTPAEEQVDRVTSELRFDIGLLARRLMSAAEAMAAGAQTRQLPLGLFGASTGAAAALMVAAERPQWVRAVVSRGGRPDLSGPALPRVHAPTLLIVGGEDWQVIELNQDALRQIAAEKRLEIVPGATHLFEEPGALDQVASLAREWFGKHLTR